MSAASMVACTAVDACSGVPVTSTLMKNFGGVDPQAALVNAQSQVTVLARMGEVGTALGRSASKLESLWTLGSAGASAAGAVGQIQGAFGDLVGQGTNLAKQIQAAGKLLQSALRILEIVKTANKAVAALMSTPWSMPAAKALATTTAVQTMSWIGIVAQAATSIGQVLSAVQQATQSTQDKTAAIGGALEAGASTTPAALAPTVSTLPAFTTQPPTMPAVPSQPAYAPPAVTAASPPGQSALPTVYESGWIARDPTPAPGARVGGGLTIDVVDKDRDGKYELSVNVPESALDRDLKVHFDAKVGDQQVTGDFDIDV